MTVPPVGMSAATRLLVIPDQVAAEAGTAEDKPVSARATRATTVTLRNRAPD